MIRFLTVAAALLLLPTLAFAQPTKGDFEFTLSGSGSNDSEFSAGAFGLSGSIGYFFTDVFEVVGRQSLSFADSEDGSSSWIASTRFGVDYHFDLDKVRPFVGVTTGAAYGDGVKESWILAPEVGVKWYVREKTFIYGMVEYQFFLNRGDDAGKSFSDGQFVYTVGIGFNF